MASAEVYQMDGSKVGPTDLNDAVFGVDPNGTLVHQVAKALLSNRRQGTASTKARAEVRGGGAKPFKQKGTGRARRGSTREPQLRGGGVVWGPHPRSYRQSISPTMRRQALCCVLSDRVRHDALCVLDALTVDKPKTKPFAEMVRKISLDGRKTLFVVAEVDSNVVLSARNLPKVRVRTASDLNALDVLDADRVVVVRDAIAKLEERLT